MTSLAIEIDERRLRVERLLLGERTAFGDRLLDELDVAMALCRERSGRSPATSDVIFFAIVSSIFSPLPVTGWAAPIWVPGAMAATSAAMVMRKPADAARFPDGPTKTTTGTRDLMMALLISRVESTSPPGVRKREDDERRALTLGALDRAFDVLRGDGVNDSVDLGADHERRCRRRRRRRLSQKPAASDADDSSPARRSPPRRGFDSFE